MKKLVFPIMMLLMLVACGKNEPVVPSLTVTPSQIELEAAGGNVNLNITSNVSWTASSSAADWCTISPASGNENGVIVVTATANTGLVEREAKITITSEAGEKVITVTQDPASLQAVLDDSRWEMTAQNSGEPGYDDLVGTVLNLRADGSAVATMDLDLGDIGTIDKVEGTWKLEGKIIVIEGDFGGIPAVLSFNVLDITSTLMNCQMDINLPLLPEGGIPVVFKKL